jgi:hypothetical protein
MNKNKLDLTLGIVNVSNVILTRRVWYLIKMPFTILNVDLIDIHLSLILCIILCLGFHDLYQFGAPNAFMAKIFIKHFKKKKHEDRS